MAVHRNRRLYADGEENERERSTEHRIIAPCNYPCTRSSKTAENPLHYQERWPTNATNVSVRWKRVIVNISSK